MKRIFKMAMVLWLGAFCAQGGIVVDTQTHSSYSPVTSTFATFDVEAGDVVVLVGSGNNTQVQDSLTTSNITWTATDVAVGGGARTLLYYAEITANGTVDWGSTPVWPVISFLELII